MSGSVIHDLIKVSSVCVGGAGVPDVPSWSLDPDLGQLPCPDTGETIVDSGAADTVSPKHVADGIPTKPTKASMSGKDYKAANGTPIRNYGQKRIEGLDKNGTKTGITT